MWESRGLVIYVKANGNTFIINIFILLVFAAQETLSKHASRTFTGWTWEAQKRNYQLAYLIHLLIGSSTKNRFERGDLVRLTGLRLGAQ